MQEIEPLRARQRRQPGPHLGVAVVQCLEREGREGRARQAEEPLPSGHRHDLEVRTDLLGSVYVLGRWRAMARGDHRDGVVPGQPTKEMIGADLVAPRRWHGKTRGDKEYVQGNPPSDVYRLTGPRPGSPRARRAA